MPQSKIVCIINSTKKYVIYKFALSSLIYQVHDPWHTLSAVQKGYFYFPIDAFPLRLSQMWFSKESE
jgi:hypothetical protein